ncbi:VrrA/YqfQ family protein [Anaerobacillus alkaliphilus]|nr:VrrA/YqfQ family protein [Anaerobacillus alkaliphilus]
MFPMPTPQMPPVSPGASMLTRGMLQGGASQLSNLPLQQGVMGQSGGLLSKLFGGAQAGGGGFTNILGMLQNAQKAIGVFQQVSPMVQQYAPFVKSLPSLISMMRNTGGSEDNELEPTESIAIEDDDNEKESYNEVKVRKKKKKKSSNNIKIKEKPVQKSTKKNTRTQSKQRDKNSNQPTKSTGSIPAPKLYI